MLLRSAVAAMVVVAAGPLLTGCAEDEVAPEGAAYPQAAPVVGQTPPSQVGVNASLPPVAPPPPPYDPHAEDVAVEGQQPAQEAAPAAAPQDEYADTDPSALTDFRSTLDPYGTWVDDATYGTVWVPSQNVVGQDFVPYQSAGHWVYDDEYTWVSDYDWGWAPFHYGRWVYGGAYGWEWIPGRVYAGAWVSWRYGWGDWAYVGWAPLGPTWGWWGGYAYGLGYVPVMPYTFCATGALFSPNLRGAVVTGPQAGVIAQNTRPYVPAHPSVNGRVGATPRVSGPSPQMLNIPASQIAHGGSANRGIAQAVAFSRPSTATAMGARAPQQAAFAGARSGVPGAAGGVGAVGAARGMAPGYPGGGAGIASGPRTPAYGSSAPSHFGGRLGSGFSGSIANQRPAPYYGRSSPSVGARPYYGASPYHGGGGYGSYGGGYGGYRGFGGGYGSYGGYHAATPGIAPGGGRRGGYSSGESSGGFHGGGGGFHGGGGGFRGGGGGGGFHGGGGRR